MAGPITHIVLALKILPLLSPTIDKGEFLVGTSFPDIRHLAQLSREQTHLEPAIWSAIIDEVSPFKAGILFHSFVDKVQIANLERNFIARPTTTYETLYEIMLKMEEDRLLYSFTDQWEEVIEYFNVIYDEEKYLCSDESILKKWHYLLQRYFSLPPTLESIDEFLQGVGNLYLRMNPTVFNVEQLINDLHENEKFYKAVFSFYDSFETLLNYFESDRSLKLNNLAYPENGLHYSLVH